MSAMKWWGWGDEGVEFTHEDKPDLAPFIERVLGIRVGAPTDVPVRFEDLPVPEPDLPDGLRAALAQAVGAEFVSVERMDRVVHTRGKSLRDLILQRRGELLARSPMWSCGPATRTRSRRHARRRSTHDAVAHPLRRRHHRSPARSKRPRDETRPVISVDLARLDRVIEIDGAVAARPRAGRRARARRLEEQLDAAGLHPRPLPRHLHVLDPGRLDRHPLLGHAVRPYGDIADLTEGAARR